MTRLRQMALLLVLVGVYTFHDRSPAVADLLACPEKCDVTCDPNSSACDEECWTTCTTIGTCGDVSMCVTSGGGCTSNWQIDHNSITFIGDRGEDFPGGCYYTASYDFNWVDQNHCDPNHDTIADCGMAQWQYNGSEFEGTCCDNHYCSGPMCPGWIE
jgi:hypothetical protein